MTTNMWPLLTPPTCDCIAAAPVRGAPPACDGGGSTPEWCPRSLRNCWCGALTAAPSPWCCCAPPFAPGSLAALADAPAPFVAAVLRPPCGWTVGAAGAALTASNGVDIVSGEPPAADLGTARRSSASRTRRPPRLRRASPALAALVSVGLTAAPVTAASVGSVGGGACRGR